MIDWLPTDRLFSLWDLIPTELGNFIPIIWVAKGYDIIRSRPGEDKHNIVCRVLDRYPHIYPVPWGAKESLTIDMMIREIDIDGLQKRREWTMMDDEDEARVRMVYVVWCRQTGNFFSFLFFSLSSFFLFVSSLQNGQLWRRTVQGVRDVCWGRLECRDS